MAQVTSAALNQETIDTEGPSSWSYAELCEKTYKLVLPSACFERDPGHRRLHRSAGDETGLEYLYNSDDVGVTLRVVGILRPNPDATATMLTGAMAYTSLLSDYVLEHVGNQPIVTAQLEDPDTDVFTGLPFATGQEVEPADAEKKEAFLSYLETCSTEEKAAMYLDAAAQPDAGPAGPDRGPADGRLDPGRHRGHGHRPVRPGDGRGRRHGHRLYRRDGRRNPLRPGGGGHGGPGGPAIRGPW